MRRMRTMFDGDSQPLNRTMCAVKAPSKPLTVLGMEFVYLYLFGIAVAFLGWLAENLVRAVTVGVWDCRFHLLPFITVYALIPFAFHILLGDPDDVAVFGHRLFRRQSKGTKIASNFISLGLICFSVFFGELIIGNLWQLLFGVELWNYAALPLHVTQYAGLIPTLGYGCGAYLIFRLIYKPGMRLIQNKVGYRTAKRICSTLGVLMMLDSLIMLSHIAVLHRPPLYWAVKLR